MSTLPYAVQASMSAAADSHGREEMQSLFDPHIKSMLKKVHDQLNFVQAKAFGNPQVVSHLPYQQHFVY